MSLTSIRQAMTGKRRYGRKAAERPQARPMRRRLALALLLLSGTGEALSLYLAYVHDRLNRDPGWRSICAINEALNCDVVISSSYASVAATPLPIWGTWFYLLLVAIIGLDLAGKARLICRSPAAIILALAAAATGASAVLAIVSVTSIGSLCLLCAGLYLTNVSLLMLAYFSVRSTNESIIGSLKSERAHFERYPIRFLAGSTAALIVLLLLRVAYSKGTAGGSDICQAVTTTLRSNPRQPIEIRVYSDYQCPHCKTLDQDLRQLRGSHLRVVLRHYPVDPACNPAVKVTGHPGSCFLAKAALCAAAQGRGPAFSDRVFDEGLSAYAAVIALARSLELDVDAFDRCLDAPRTAESLHQSIDEAGVAGVSATPTLFVNGQKHVGKLRPTDLVCLLSARGSGDVGGPRGTVR